VKPVRIPRRANWLALIPMFAAGADGLSKDEPPPKGYVCYRAKGPIRVDGKLDEASWAAAPWTDEFVDIEGDVKPRPRFATRAKMLWDDAYFYVAAELKEPHVWGTLTKHDSVIFHDNDFEVFIDPDGDNHEYYEFEINALNTGWDLFLKKPYRDGGPAQNEWEIPGLKTGVSIFGTLNKSDDSDTGWTLELAFPWAALAEYAHRASPPDEGDRWRVNFSRVEWRHVIQDGKYEKVPNAKEDNWVWSPQGVVDMHRPERWGYVQFTRGEPGTVKFEADPTGPARDRLMAVYHAQRAFRDKAKRWAGSLDELGIDPKRLPAIGLKSTAEGYEATVEVATAPGLSRLVSIAQDSRIKVAPERAASAR
jgi:hypothetical protein